jgi:AcrR family transcriptional regulator
VENPGTRERLIATAMQLFWQKGYGATSVADILHAADAKSGSLYHFFPGKQDLLLAVLARYREGLRPMLLEPAWAREPDPLARVFALLARYRASIVQTDCTYGCPIGALALELHEPDPVVREALAVNFAAWTAAVEECLAGAGDRLPADVNHRELAQLVLTVMEGGVMQARTHRDVAFFDGSVRQLAAYFAELTKRARGQRQTGKSPRRTRGVPHASAPKARKRSRS